MITVTEAQNLIDHHLNNRQLAAGASHHVDIHLPQVAPLLRQAICADRPHPPFHRVTMDGIAIAYRDWLNGYRQFAIIGQQRAGMAPLGGLQQGDRHQPGHGIEVMTGAVLPATTDCVIRYEDLRIKHQVATVTPESEPFDCEPFMNVHREGSDASQGQELVAAGKRMQPAHYAIAAAMGYQRLAVAAAPQIAIVSTGDEIVGIADTPQPFQIRGSNSVAIQAALQQHGLAHCGLHHLRDDPQESVEKLAAIIAANDVVIITGGVSMGKHDYIPQALADLAVTKVFHKIRQKPGKPMWFGVAKDKTLVFGLPGNPVSTLVTLRRYVIPALKKSQGYPAASYQPLFGQLTAPVTFTKNLTYFAPVQVSYDERARILATPITNNGSGDLVALATSDGFVELPAEPQQFAALSCFPLYLW